MAETGVCASALLTVLVIGRQQLLGLSLLVCFLLLLLFWSSCEGVLLKAGNIFADKAGRVSAASRCRRVCCRWCWTSVATQAREWWQNGLLATDLVAATLSNCRLRRLRQVRGEWHRPCRHHESERNDGERNPADSKCTPELAYKRADRLHTN